MRKLILGAMASVMTLSAVSVGSADAQPYYRHHGYYHHRSCYSAKRHAGNQGTALGAVSGGVLGGVIGHGLVGGLVGAGVGAVAGHAIAKSTVHC
ncbi:MAG: hypothetical protein ACYDD1_02900 [Caulobacteraceae bacterium]